jgi:hypothetical protein
MGVTVAVEVEVEVCVHFFCFIELSQLRLIEHSEM